MYFVDDAVKQRVNMYTNLQTERIHVNDLIFFNLNKIILQKYIFFNIFLTNKKKIQYFHLFLNIFQRETCTLRSVHVQY